MKKTKRRDEFTSSRLKCSLLVDENVHDVHGEHPRHCLVAQDGAHKLSTAHTTQIRNKNQTPDGGTVFLDPQLKIKFNFFFFQVLDVFFL